MVDIARLRKYAESVKDVRGALCELSVNSMISILDQLEAAQKDAARYRWIRETYSEDGIEFWPDSVAFADTEEKLDAAIDAVMASKS